MDPRAPILPQPGLFGARCRRRGEHRDPQSGGAAVPVSAVQADLSLRRVGTPFYRLHKPAELAVLVLTLLSHGCPTQAIVAAFGLDERTVARWLVGSRAALPAGP